MTGKKVLAPMCLFWVACATDLGTRPDTPSDAGAPDAAHALDAGESDADAQLGANTRDADAAPEPSEHFAAIYADIIAPKCAIPYCHVATHRGGLNMTTAALAHSRLVGTAAGAQERDPYSLCKDSGLLRVSPYQPDESLLMQKLTAAPGETCGEPMPLDLAPLPAGDIARIRRWIAQGALDD